MKGRQLIFKNEKHRRALIRKIVSKENNGAIIWVPAKRAIELLGISIRKLYYMKKQGAIDIKKIGSKTYYDVAELYFTEE